MESLFFFCVCGAPDLHVMSLFYVAVDTYDLSGGVESKEMDSCSSISYPSDNYGVGNGHPTNSVFGREKKKGSTGTATSIVSL